MEVSGNTRRIGEYNKELGKTKKGIRENKEGLVNARRN